MRRAAGTRHPEAIITAAMAIVLAGCVLKGKPPAAAAAVPPAPKPVTTPAPAPAAPPPPLSIPQTHAELPAAQPLTAEALATTEPPGEPPAPPPAPPKKGRSQPATPRPKPEAAAPANPPVAATPPAVEPEPRPRIQEIIPAEDLNRLRASANLHKEQIKQRLDHLPKRGLTKEQRDMVETIRSFVRLSDEAERNGDMRKANELAERGAVLAQGLPGAR